MKKISLDEWAQEWEFVVNKETIHLLELPFSVNELAELFKIELLTYSLESAFKPTTSLHAKVYG